MTRVKNAVSVHHCARRRVGIVADYNRVRKHASQVNSGKTRTPTVPQQPMRDSHSLNTVDNISSPRQCTRLVNCHELAGTCDTRQATEIKPAKNISPTDHLHSRPVCHHHGMSRTTLGNKDKGGIGTRPVTFFIHLLFIFAVVVGFLLPSSSSIFIHSSLLSPFFSYSLPEGLSTTQSAGYYDTWRQWRLLCFIFFPPTLPIFSRTY